MRMRLLLAALALPACLAATSPAGARAGPFIIFFDGGDASLDAADRAILDNGAAALAQSGHSVILVGHADRAGDAAYNRDLACRRAQAVRAYLLTRGIPAGRIAVQSAGEERPMVATEDGVTEIQNRHVLLSFREAPLPAAAERADGCLPVDF